jgi:dTDP-glucose pyrophosphorylase
MAGKGTRTKTFSNSPKPLIPIGNRFMFEVAVQSLKVPITELIFVVSQEHVDVYKIDDAIQNRFPNSKVVVQTSPLTGPLTSILEASSFIDDGPLLILDCDMFNEVDLTTLFQYDIGLCVQVSNNPNYSYVDMDKRLIKEKVTISDKALSGIVFWKRGTDFVKYANASLNLSEGELFQSSAIQLALDDGLSISLTISNVAFDLSTQEGILGYMRGANE